ncbi:MAG: hypothetical protein LBQ84_00980 [Flavobacteriaceae bacterium]|jgi:hypothetical protein|nr:hypothetical protein [Flavobacteriaceae bacterium]
MKVLKTFKISLLALSFSLFMPKVFGQNITIDAEIRNRNELRNGFRSPLADTLKSALIGGLRTKLNFDYAQDKIKTRISLINTHYYGETRLSDTGNSVGVFEAWGEYNFTPEFSFTLGRKSLNYGRLFSGNWSNTPRAHDLLLLKYTSAGIDAHLGGAWNNAGNDMYETLYQVSNNYKSLLYLWLHKQIERVSLSAMFINDNFQYGEENNPSTSNRYTTGFDLELQDEEIPWYIQAEGYYQFGKDTHQRELSASLLAAKASYRATDRVTATIGGEFLSGSKYDLAPDKNNTFNKLYGSNHSFNGSMEYWSTPPAQGLVDLFAGINVKVLPKLGIDLTFHKFSVSRDLAVEGYNRDIGSELDLTVNYDLSDQFSIEGGWSAYFKTNGTDLLKKQTGIDTKFPHWAYIMITFNPTFFSKKE